MAVATEANDVLGGNEGRGHISPTVEMSWEVESKLLEYGIDPNSPEFVKSYNEALDQVLAKKSQIAGNADIDGVQQGDGFLEGRITPKSAIRITPNGCSYSPDRHLGFSFRNACNQHDYCYAPGSRTNRLDCDNQFLGAMLSVCNGVNNGLLRFDCRAKAGAYYAAVRAAGSGFYKGSGANN